MSTRTVDEIRQSVLDRVERGERATKGGIMAGAVLEALMLAVALVIIDWRDPLQKLLFIFFVLSYSIVVLGLFALGGHVTRTVGHLLAAIEELQLHRR